MANNGTEYLPPAWHTNQVMWGVGYLWTAPFGTALPSYANLGDQTQWVGWNYVGATDQGVQVAFTPNMTNIQIEEQPIPVAALMSTATFQITCSMAEETLANIKLAYTGGGSIVTTAPSTGVPGTSVLSLSSTPSNLACAILGQNQLGFPRVMYVPKINSAGTVTTNWRRAANARLYPITLNSLCDLSQIQIIDITAAGL